MQCPAKTKQKTRISNEIEPKIIPNHTLLLFLKTELKLNQISKKNILRTPNLAHQRLNTNTQ